MSEPKTVELRIQKIDALSTEGRLIEFIKKGKLGGVYMPPVQIALSMLSMCLQPLADEGGVSKGELQKRTRMAVELLLLHCKTLCDWAGLDFASFFASAVGTNGQGNGVGAACSSSTPTRIESDEELEEDQEEELATFSLSRANFNELGL